MKTNKAQLTSSEGGLSERFSDFLNIAVKAPPFSWNKVSSVRFSMLHRFLRLTIVKCLWSHWLRQNNNNKKTVNTMRHVPRPSCSQPGCHCCQRDLSVCPGFPERTTIQPVKGSSGITLAYKHYFFSLTKEIINEAKEHCRHNIYW